MAVKLAEIAGKVGSEVEGDPELMIRNVARIEEAGEGDITFLVNTKYSKFLAASSASAVIVPREMDLETDKALLRTDNPYFTFLKVVTLFYPPRPPIGPGIHSTAIVDPSTELGRDVAIGPCVVIGKGCRIGKGSVLLPHTILEDNVTIGEKCLIHARVTVRRDTEIGDRVILHSGAVIGSDGFGFAPEAGVYYKIPQVGKVIIEDDVEIGANATVDRATLGETRIKKGVKLDNLIQVGHNCTIGENTVIAAQSGLSGSTHIGKGVRVGGQVGFAGHMTIGDGAALGAKSGVSKSIPAGQFFSGIPARPHIEELKREAASLKMAEKIKEIKDLKKRIEALEKQVREKC